MWRIVAEWFLLAAFITSEAAVFTCLMCDWRELDRIEERRFKY